MLREMLSANLFLWLLIFARIGAGCMFLPGLSSTLVSARVRLLFALILSFVLLPVLGPRLPAAPVQPLGLMLLLLVEVTVGIFVGLVAQALVSALDIAGTFISYGIGITNMFSFDPISEQQSQLITGFLGLLAVTLIFASDTHHLMLRALVDSYDMAPPGAPFPAGDIAQTLMRTMSTSVLMGLRLAAPVMLFQITYNSGLALINRLAPQLPVFLMGLPLQIFAGLGILMIVLPAVMLIFLTRLNDGLAAFMSFG